MDRLLKERENSRKRTNSWDGTKTLVFREVDDARHLTLEQSTEVVDITLSHQALHQIGSKGTPEGHRELIRLTWDSVDPRSCVRSSYETVHSDQNILRTIVQCLCENNFSTLRKLCRTFYNAYTTKLTCIKINPLTFTFLHQSGQGIEEMRHLGPKLASVLKTQLSGSLPETDDVKLNLQFCSDDTVSREYRTQIPGESETEMRFSQMEKQIESLRCMLEEQRTLFGRTLNASSLPTGAVFRQNEESDSGDQNHVAEPVSLSEGVSDKRAGAAEGNGFTQETCLVTFPVTVTAASTSVAEFRQVNQMTGITGTYSNIDSAEASSDVTTVPEYVLDPKHKGHKAGVTQPSSLRLSSTDGFGGAPGFSDVKNIRVVEQGPSLGGDQPYASAAGPATSQQSLNYEGRKTKDSSGMKVNPAPPRATGMDTILCLDASSSMGPDGFHEMKQIACSFIDGLEDITSKYEIEENVGVVAFGGTPRIEHHVSNDYGSIIAAIENIPFGGRSPLFEALQECLQALNYRGSTLSISNVHRIPPRIIIITDGKASDDGDVGIDVETIDDNVKLHVIQMMKEFQASSSLPRPVVWIPAGNANLEFMKSLAKLAGGIYISGKDVTHLCKYQRVQVTVGKIIVCMQNNIGCGSGNEADINEIMNIFAGDLDPKDKEEVIKTVKDKLEGKPGAGCEGGGGGPADYDNIIERDDPVLPCLGTRVVRGPDWEWGNQDTDGSGTVINHNNDPRKHYWIWVHWDNGTHNKYRYGKDGAFDVKIVECQPRITESLFDIGCEVQRGPDWQVQYGDQDGGPGGVGVIIRVKDNGMVKVRWKLTHQINEYRYGYDGKMDLILRDPVDIVREYTKVDDTPGTDTSKDQAYPTQTKWMWKDEAGHWLSYSEEDEKRLEQTYSKRPKGSCLLNINGSQYRVLFKEWKQRRLEDNVRMEVQRRPMDQ